MTIRTLIVDDEPLEREKIRTLLLTERDFEVIGECGDGEEAVSRIREESPDAVFLDIRMPKLDGLGLTQKLREKYNKRELPIVLVSVLSEEEDIVAGFEAGANDYLVKPYRTAELLAKIRILLKEREFLRKPKDPVLPVDPLQELADDDTKVQALGGGPKAAPHYFFDKYAPAVVDGHLDLSDRPGFGMELDDDKIESRELMDWA